MSWLKLPDHEALLERVAAFSQVEKPSDSLFVFGSFEDTENNLKNIDKKGKAEVPKAQSDTARKVDFGEKEFVTQTDDSII